MNIDPAAGPSPSRSHRKEPLCVLADVTKNYRKGGGTIAALQSLSLSIRDGEWLAIQGRTGSGKTTLLQLLGAMDRPSSGTVRFAGRDLNRLAETELTSLRANAIGFVFQTFNLIPTLSTIENVEAALVPLHVPSGDRQARAREALEAVGLGDRARHLPSEPVWRSAATGRHRSSADKATQDSLGRRANRQS